MEYRLKKTASFLCIKPEEVYSLVSKEAAIS